MPAYEKLLELIASGVTKVVLKEEVARKGIKTLRDDGIQKVREGLTTIEEILRVTQKEA